MHFNLLKNKTIQLAINRFFYFAIIAVVVWFLVQNFGEIIQYDFQINWYCLAVAFFSLLCSYLLMAFLWTKVAKSFALDAPYVLANKAWFLGQLGKYLPGKVVLLLVRIDCYRKYSKRKVTTATGVEYIATLAASALFMFFAISLSAYLIPNAIRFAALGAFILSLFFLWPPLFTRIINLVSRIFGKDEIREYPPYRKLLGFICLYMIVYVVQGIGVYAVFDSLAPIDMSCFLLLTGSYEGASLIGTAALFAPGGLGVRESLLFIVLPSFLPKEIVIVAVLLIRVITIFIECFLAAAFVFVEKKFFQSTYSLETK